MKKNTGEEAYDRLISMVVPKGYSCVFQFLTNTANEESKKFVPLYPSLPPEKIRVRYALKPLSENPKVIEVPASQFCTIAKLPQEFLWTNSVYLPGSVKTHLQKNPIRGIDPVREEADDQRSRHIKITYADQRLTSLQEAPFVICWIDDVVGWGVFSDRDLPENLFVGAYAGKMQVIGHGDPQEDHYRMELRHKIFDHSAVKASYEVGSVSAKHLGNFTRFLNAMPTPEQVQSGKCEPVNAKEKIATANCTYQHGMLDNVPAQFIVTKRAIKRGEQLSIPYWRYGSRFSLFNNETGRRMPDLKLVSLKMKEDSIIEIQLYLPQLDKTMNLPLKKTSFVIILLKNHLQLPNISKIELIHADYLRYFAEGMDKTELQKICADDWPKVKSLQQEFQSDEIAFVPAILGELNRVTNHQWKLSDSGNYHHFELQETLETVQKLHDFFVQAKFGYVKIEKFNDRAILHWHENPFQNFSEGIITLKNTVDRNFSAVQSTPKLI